MPVKTLVEQITEARISARQARAGGYDSVADAWDAKVDKLLDQLPREHPCPTSARGAGTQPTPT